MLRSNAPSVTPSRRLAMTWINTYPCHTTLLPTFLSSRSFTFPAQTLPDCIPHSPPCAFLPRSNHPHYGPTHDLFHWDCSSMDLFFPLCFTPIRSAPHSASCPPLMTPPLRFFYDYWESISLFQFLPLFCFSKDRIFSVRFTYQTYNVSNHSIPARTPSPPPSSRHPL